MACKTASVDGITGTGSELSPAEQKSGCFDIRSFLSVSGKETPGTSRVLIQDILQRLEQFRNFNGLSNMAVHTGGKCLLLIIIKGIRCHRHDGDVG